MAGNTTVPSSSSSLQKSRSFWLSLSFRFAIQSSCFVRTCSFAHNREFLIDRSFWSSFIRLIVSSMNGNTHRDLSALGTPPATHSVHLPSTPPGDTNVYPQRRH